jgi:putative FmdB family regulatory protein
MPIYEYEHLEPKKSKKCPSGRGRFEVVQKFGDEPLAACPECGGKVERVFSTPAVHGTGRTADTLSNKNLAEKGFTKYVKAGDGHYEKATGKGPNVIKR